MTIFSDEKKNQEKDNDVYKNEFFKLNDVKEFFPAFYNDFIQRFPAILVSSFPFE